MSSIEENRNKITLFFMKSSGKIKGFCSGIQTMNYFGDEKEDYSKIIDYLIVTEDEININNRDYYRVENNKLIFKGLES